jgi:copper resistance protein D
LVEIGGWDIAAALAKAVIYAATLGAAGTIFFTAYGGALLRDNQRVTIRRLIAILAVVGIAASGLRILLLGGSMAGEAAGMLDTAFMSMIMGGGEGRATCLRTAGLLLALFALSKKPAFQAPSVMGAIIAATSFAWVGHVHGLSPNTAPSLLLGLHLLCAAFWLGALPPLWLISASGNEQQTAAAAARFGKLALRVVALLVAAGASLLWMFIGAAGEFWSSGYGISMAIKLLAVACILSAAAWNKLALTPKLLTRQPGATVSFRRSVSAEIFLGALILTITAALTSLSGPP